MVFHWETSQSEWLDLVHVLPSLYGQLQLLGCGDGIFELMLLLFHPINNDVHSVLTRCTKILIHSSVEVMKYDVNVPAQLVCQAVIASHKMVCHNMILVL
jgi:hypothetical protein